VSSAHGRKLLYQVSSQKGEEKSKNRMQLGGVGGEQDNNRVLRFFVCFVFNVFRVLTLK